MKHEVIVVTWDEISQVWIHKLWKNRETPIRSMSSMLYLGGYDLDIYENYKPTFFGIFDNGDLIGVNSGHKVTETQYRSRGLYVDEKYRGYGLGQKLLNATIDQAKVASCTSIWSYPRRSAIKTYLSVGFEQTSDWIDDNTYVLLKF